MLVVSLLSTDKDAKGSSLTPMAPLGFAMSKSLGVAAFVPEYPRIIKRLVLVVPSTPNPATVFLRIVPPEVSRNYVVKGNIVGVNNGEAVRFGRCRRSAGISNA